MEILIVPSTSVRSVESWCLFEVCHGLEQFCYRESLQGTEIVVGMFPEQPFAFFYNFLLLWMLVRFL